MSAFRKQCELLVQGICRNLLTYAEHLTDGGLDQTPIMPVVFTSALNIEKESDGTFFRNLKSSHHWLTGNEARASNAQPSLGLLCLYLKQQIGQLVQTLSALDKLRHDDEHVESLEMNEAKEYAAFHYKGAIDDLPTDERTLFALLAIQKLQQERSIEASTLICMF